MQCTVRAVLPCPPHAAFDLSVDAERFPALFRGFGPVPGLRRIEVNGPLAAGCVRRVESVDGQVLTERVVALDRPALHVYMLDGLRPPLGWLVRGGLARWTFDPATTGCAVTWHYAFTPRSAWAAPIAGLILFGAMRPAMRRCLTAMAEAVAPQPLASSS